MKNKSVFFCSPQQLLHEGHCQHCVDVVVDHLYGSSPIETCYSFHLVGSEGELPHAPGLFAAVFLIVGLDIVCRHHEDGIDQADEQTHYCQLLQVEFVLVLVFLQIAVHQLFQVLLSTQKTDPTKHLLCEDRLETVIEVSIF
jgi:hypothetical protein